MKKLICSLLVVVMALTGISFFWESGDGFRL